MKINCIKCGGPGIQLFTSVVCDNCDPIDQPKVITNKITPQTKTKLVKFDSGQPPKNAISWTTRWLTKESRDDAFDRILKGDTNIQFTTKPVDPARNLVFPYGIAKII